MEEYQSICDFSGCSLPIRHLVLLKFKADTAPAQVQAIEAAFVALASKISAVQSMDNMHVVGHW